LPAVDCAGDGVPVVIDRLTGEIRKAQVFVAVLGASSFTFAHASWTQALPDWIDAHVHAFEAIGGVPHLLVPDNTKTQRSQSLCGIGTTLLRPFRVFASIGRKTLSIALSPARFGAGRSAALPVLAPLLNRDT